MGTLLKGPETRSSIRKSEEGRVSEASSVRNDYTDGDARRELESSRHVKEPHVVEPPSESEDMQSSVPVSQVGSRHSAGNPLVDILPQTATDALAEAAKG